VGPGSVHPAHPRVLDAGRLRRTAHPARADRQADRGKAESERVDKRHTALERAAGERVQLIEAETDHLQALLVTNTELTGQVAKLTREIHALVKARDRR
jgi:hypothetical protein